MKLSVIYNVARADLLERTRRFSYVAVCAAAVFFAFFSIPDTEAPMVSIVMEPSIFSQGTNPSWIPIAIALCGGLLFPIMGFSYVKNNICMDRNNGFLYLMQSMNMKKTNYVFGKFISNLILLTLMWILVILSASIVLLLQFPKEQIGFYDFISPFFSIYPGIVFASAFAVCLETISLFRNKNGNAVGITMLFAMFLINYLNINSSSFLFRIFDFSSYRWIMDSINHSVVPIIGRTVQETGILVPGGMFAGSTGSQDLVFHGLVYSKQYLLDKMTLIAISLLLVFLAILFLETMEKEQRKFSIKTKEKSRSKTVKKYAAGQFTSELRMLFKDRSNGWWFLISCLWVTSFLMPIEYVQGYIWIIMLLFSVVIFSQMGCREYENGMAEYLVTIKFALYKQIIYTYIGGVLFLLFLTLPLIIRFLLAAKFSYVISYLVFSCFIPALACFSGEYFKTRRPFETVYLLLCFLLINLPAFLFLVSNTFIMLAGTILLLPAVIYKRAKK